MKRKRGALKGFYSTEPSPRTFLLCQRSSGHSWLFIGLQQGGPPPYVPLGLFPGWPVYFDSIFVDGFGCSRQWMSGHAASLAPLFSDRQRQVLVALVNLDFPPKMRHSLKTGFPLNGEASDEKQATATAQPGV
jgi:hypothetical protein